jgi:hypothetical protein
MNFIPKLIGAIGVVALTLAAVPESSELDHRIICSTALTPDRSAWEQDPNFARYVVEAARRRLTVDTCRQLLIGAPEHPPASAPTRLAASTASHPSAFIQQGPKLVGSGASGGSQQGSSVALSADGNTAIVGSSTGFSETTHYGGAWIFTRKGGVWTQQAMLRGSGAIGLAAQGASVALSADGNTAIVGGPLDNLKQTKPDAGDGAAWVFTRSGESWTQQGPKLISSGAVGPASQGYSVALSADGNTAIVGGYRDTDELGAAWVFTRKEGVWTQQGRKLVGSGAVGKASQGYSLALSGDGNTAIVGGFRDANYVGAAWVFTRKDGVWTQQSRKLVGSEVVELGPEQGWSVALSADGDTAIIGGPGDAKFVGAAWVFTRKDGVWTQQGRKLIGSDVFGKAEQGYSLALSGDGNTAIVGGYHEPEIGAAWVFTRQKDVWSQLGSKLVGSGAVGRPFQGFSVGLSADGKTAIVGGVMDGYTTSAPDFNHLPRIITPAVGAVWVFSKQ